MPPVPPLSYARGSTARGGLADTTAQNAEHMRELHPAAPPPALACDASAAFAETSPSSPVEVLRSSALPGLFRCGTAPSSGFTADAPHPIAASDPRHEHAGPTRREEEAVAVVPQQ